MKIALFTETYLPHINGVVTHVKILKEGLEQLGHEVLVVTADAKTSRHYVKDNVLYCPAISNKKLYGYGLAKPISRTRLRHIKDFAPDIIHIHNEFGIGFSGIVCAKLLRIPLVYTLHTMYDEYIYYIVPKALVKTTKRVTHNYFKLIAKASTAITGPSVKCQEYCNNTGVKRQVNVIPNAVELSEFSLDTVTDEQKLVVRSEHGIPNDSFLACFVGRLGREKSVDVLLDFWAKSISPTDNMRLMIVGDGPVKDELTQQVSTLDIADMVIFTGKVEHEKLAPYLATSDIYATASLSDTNSISMLEGMSAGLPVLQRTDPLNSGQVVDGVNGYNFDNAEQFAQRMHHIRNMDKDELVRLKQSVIKSVKNSGATTLASNTLAVYHKAIAQAAVPKSIFLLPQLKKDE